jgi:N-acetyltransferase 10
MDIPLVVDILSPNVTTKELEEDTIEEIEKERLASDVTLLDFKRIEAYSKNLADFHLIIDLLPALSRLFFAKQLGSLKLSYLQAAILVGLGLQHKSIDNIAKCKPLIYLEFNLPVSQCLALFNKSIRKFYSLLKRIFEVLA